MAADALTPTVPEQVIVHSPEIVGNAFARQYYMILEHSPWLAYRFYLDKSKVGRADNDGEVMGCTTTMEAINDKIRSYGSMKAEIDFVDAQESYNGGVFVLVNGSMMSKDGSRRKFNQGFFLAPQDKGYYVLNDVFRYSKEDYEIPDITEEQDPSAGAATPFPDNHISELTNGDMNNEDVQEPNDDLPVEEVKAEVHKELPIEKVHVEVQAQKEEPLAEIVAEVSQESWGIVESSDKVKGFSKKSSYASIVMKDTPPTMPSPTQPKSVAKMQDRQVPVAPVSMPVAVSPSSKEGIVDSGNNQVTEGKSRSIYCRNLPKNVPVSRVEEVFADFGPVKEGGVQVRHNMNSCFGFVEFETADAAQSAIQKSCIILDGHKVSIEEKKSTVTRENFYSGNIRGRYPPGRGGNNFRGDGGRGRGGYGGGRGYGHGESNDDNFRGGGGRGYHNRNEGYQRHDQTGNGTGRMNRGGGLGHVSTRAQKVNA